MIAHVIDHVGGIIAPMRDLIFSFLSCVDNAGRAALEQRIIEVASLPGCGVALCELAGDPTVAPEPRLLALIVLRKQVIKQWTSVSAEDRAGIRGALPPLLADGASRVRTAAVRAVCMRLSMSHNCGQARPLAPSATPAIVAGPRDCLDC